ncbi:MAG: hypothetical protein K8T10_15335 [Candidatus Eremiobacteraeota bacterium]|nr:hypothetical protein [Candidatus Eremiobacteraeota bacterium]
MNIPDLIVNFFALSDPLIPEVLEKKTPGAYTAAIPGVPPAYVAQFALWAAIALILLVIIIQYIARKKFINPIPAEAKKKRLFYTILLNIFIVIFFFGALELTLQIYVKYHPYQNFIPDNVLFWKPKPGTGGRFIDKNNPNSKYNFLPLTNYLTEKPEGTVRILCLGESRTAGLIEPHTTHESSYPKQIQKKLKKEYPNIPIQVHNGGVPGYTSYQGLFMLKNTVKQFKPDIVTLAFAWHEGSIAYARDKDVLSNSKFIQCTRKMLYNSQIYLLLRRYILRKKLKYASNKRPIFLRVDCDDYRDNMNEIIRMGKKHDFEVVFITLPISPEPSIRDYYIRKVAPYHNILQEMSGERNILYIDLKNKMLNSKDEILFNRLLQKDRSHFTKWGREWIASQVTEQMKENGIIDRALERVSGSK